MTKYKKNGRIPFTDDLMFSLVVSDENICTYDYIGADLPVYFFEKFDRQNCLQFGDEAYSIILNTACSPHKVPESLKPLFEYINDPSKGVGDALVDHIDERVKKFNTHEWRRKHMTLQELMDRNYSVIKGIKSKSILVYFAV